MAWGRDHQDHLRANLNRESLYSNSRLGWPSRQGQVGGTDPDRQRQGAAVERTGMYSPRVLVRTSHLPLSRGANLNVN